MSHDDPELEQADCLAITFEMQKKDDKNDTIHHKATRDQTMCPVQAAAKYRRRHPHLGIANRAKNHTRHREASGECIKRHSESYRRGRAEHQGRRGGNSLDTIGSRHGHVPRRTTCVPDHVDGTVVERCIPTLH